MDICKAKDCVEIKVNDNFCKQHTHKLHPIYIRYKRLQENIDLTSPSTIPELIKLYGKCAKIHALRQKYRKSLKTEFHDWGHEKALDLIWEKMQEIEQKLYQLVQTSDVPVKEINEETKEIEEDLESESETAELTLENIFSVHKKYKFDNPECMNALNNLSLKVLQDSFTSLNTIVKHNLQRTFTEYYEVIHLSEYLEFANLNLSAVTFMFLTILGYTFKRENLYIVMTYIPQEHMYSYNEYYNATKVLISDRKILALALAVIFYINSRQHGNMQAIIVDIQIKDQMAIIEAKPRAGFKNDSKICTPVPEKYYDYKIGCKSCQKEYDNRQKYKSLDKHVTEYSTEVLIKHFKKKENTEDSPLLFG